MSTTDSNVASTESDAGAVASAAASLRAAIDASCRQPVLFFFGTAIFWLMAGTVLALISSIKLHNPIFLDQDAWLTFGRVRPAHLNTVIYGWASAAGIGVGIWLMARLCQTPLRAPYLLSAAAMLWNIGVALGVFGILAGDSTSIEWLEFPPYASFLLFVSYACIGVWTVLMFQERVKGHVYIAQWYLLAALFWFPWLYATAQLLLIVMPAQGSVQGIVNWWFAHNMAGLWFVPLGLAAAYYLIPKVLGKPIYGYSLAVLGFWSMALFAAWNGGQHLIGGPLPA